MEKSCKTCDQYKGQERIIPCGSYKEAKDMDKIELTEEQAREMFRNIAMSEDETIEHWKQLKLIKQNPVEEAEDLYHHRNEHNWSWVMSKQNDAIQYLKERQK
jgi:hypothetical protein